MWHYVTTLVATAFFAMAACDSSTEGSSNVLDTSTSETGKVDNPYPPDTIGTEGTETYAPILPREQVCPNLMFLVMKDGVEDEMWKRQGTEDILLAVTVNSVTGGGCQVTIDDGGFLNYPIHFYGVDLPVESEFEDPTAVGGFVTMVVFYEDSLLKIRVDYDGQQFVLCFER